MVVIYKLQFIKKFSYCSIPLVGLGLLVLRYRRHNYLDTLHSVWLLWTRDRSVAESST